MMLSGNCALITGASRGIGAETARALAAEGVNVVLLARGAAAIEALASEIGEQARAIPCDVSNYDDIAAAVDTAVTTFGSLDIVINNAGVIEPISHLAKSDPAEWGRVIDINLKGVY